MDPIVIALGLIIGIPASALAYWWTKRNQKRGYGAGLGGDYSSGGGHGGDSGGGSDSSA